MPPSEPPSGKASGTMGSRIHSKSSGVLVTMRRSSVTCPSTSAERSTADVTPPLHAVEADAVHRLIGAREGSADIGAQRLNAQNAPTRGDEAAVAAGRTGVEDVDAGQ